MISRPAVDRWITSLHPMFDVIATKVKTLHLGTPRVEVGPRLLHKESAFDSFKIRKGAVWLIAGKNTGFHVDFMTSGLRIKAWHGKERTASVWALGKITEVSLKRDLSICLAAAGLTDLARTDAVRAELFPSKNGT